MRCDVSKTWPIVRTSDIIASAKRSIISGPFGSSIGRQYFVNEGIPVIRGNNLSTDIGMRFIDNGFVYLTPEKADELGTWAEKHDIVFTAAGTIGQVGILGVQKFERYIISNKQIRLRVNTDLVVPLFAYYWFSRKEMLNEIISKNTGSTIPLINIGIIKNLPFCLPSIPEQEFIVEMLSCLDDKIELNNKINANLEAQAQAFFRSWFVDFEPFQDGEFVDSELGPIPKGWQIKKLIDICAYSTDRIRISECSVDNYISTENMLPNKRGKTSASSLPSVANVTMYRPNDILISNIRPYFRKIWLADCVGGCSNDVLAIRASNNRDSSYLYNLLFGDDFFNYATNTSKGTKMPRGDKSAILAYPFAYPQDTSIICKFSNIHKAIAARVALNQKENDILTALRDTLLPKLMSGEIEVPIV